MKIKNIIALLLLLTIATYPQVITGLWIGTVEVNKVNEVYSGANNTQINTPAPVKYPFNLQYLFHTDSSGVTKLLKEVYIMQSKDSNHTRVLVTDETRFSDFEGIIRKGDNKLVPVRLTSPSIDFDTTKQNLILNGAISNEGMSVVSGVDIIHDKLHPTNPFRHQFHPNHKEGRTITRSFSIEINASNIDNSPSVGQTRLRATYRETLIGLHREALKVSGPMTLTQISTIGILNPSASGK